MPAAKPTPERNLLVFTEEGKTLALTVPGGCKVTYGPWAPPKPVDPRTGFRHPGEPGRARGTLRVYQGTKENIIALITGVTGFYEEEMNVKVVDPDILGAANLNTSAKDKEEIPF